MLGVSHSRINGNVICTKGGSRGPLCYESVPGELIQTGSSGEDRQEQRYKIKDQGCCEYVAIGAV